MHPVQYVRAFIVETLRPESEAISEREVLMKEQIDRRSTALAAIFIQKAGYRTKKAVFAAKNSIET